jgi:hypothetical protein
MTEVQTRMEKLGDAQSATRFRMQGGPKFNSRFLQKFPKSHD